MSFKIENGTISFAFDLREFVDQLTEEEKMELVEYVTWDSVLDQAIKRLTGESDSWESDDDKLTLEVLCKMEENLLSGYKWNALSDLDTLAKNVTAHEHLYWKMWHDPINGQFFRKWLEDNKIESNYTHNLPNYAELRKLVETRLAEFNSTESA